MVISAAARTQIGTLRPGRSVGTSAWVAVLLVPTLLLSTAEAQSAPICAPNDVVEPLRLLRQASLDLRNMIPSHTESAKVLAAEDPTKEAEDLLEEIVGSEAYYTQLRERHRKMLWSSLEQNPMSLQPILSRLRRVHLPREEDPSQFDSIWFVLDKIRYRGGRVPCRNTPASFDPDSGEILTTVSHLPDCPPEGCNREGYVLVEPYWAPGTKIRVCAFDAQTATSTSSGEPCTNLSISAECGCGENLLRCMGEEESLPLRRALAEEPARIFEWLARNDHSYLEAFSTPTTLVNGLTAHFYRYQVEDTEPDAASVVVFDTAYGSIPRIGYHDTEWRRIQREPMHAGVLTTTAYQLRFTTDRARASKFYETFYCQPFVPAAGGLPPGSDNPDPNLRERAGCRDCHRVLEPAADHWARWREGEQAGFFRPDFMSFETPRQVMVGGSLIEDCAACGTGTGRACSFFCNKYFVTRDNSHEEEFRRFAGLPMASSWREAGDLARMELGPKGLVDEPHEQLAVARCTVRRLSEELLQRPLTTEELPWMEAHTSAFIASGYDYNELVRSLIRDPKYRAVR